jgi:hypothetical protein
MWKIFREHLYFIDPRIWIYPIFGLIPKLTLSLLMQKFDYLYYYGNDNINNLMLMRNYKSSHSVFRDNMYLYSEYLLRLYIILVLPFTTPFINIFYMFMIEQIQHFTLITEIIINFLVEEIRIACIIKCDRFFLLINLLMEMSYYIMHSLIHFRYWINAKLMFINIFTGYKVEWVLIGNIFSGLSLSYSERAIENIRSEFLGNLIIVKTLCNSVIQNCTIYGYEICLSQVNVPNATMQYLFNICNIEQKWLLMRKGYIGMYYNTFLVNSTLVQHIIDKLLIAQRNYFYGLLILIILVCGLLAFYFKNLYYNLLIGNRNGLAFANNFKLSVLNYNINYFITLNNEKYIETIHSKIHPDVLLKQYEIEGRLSTSKEVSIWRQQPEKIRLFYKFVYKGGHNHFKSRAWRTWPYLMVLENLFERNKFRSLFNLHASFAFHDNLFKRFFFHHPYFYHYIDYLKHIRFVFNNFNYVFFRLSEQRRFRIISYVQILGTMNKKIKPHWPSKLSLVQSLLVSPIPIKPDYNVEVNSTISRIISPIDAFKIARLPLNGYGLNRSDWFIKFSISSILTLIYYAVYFLITCMYFILVLVPIILVRFLSKLVFYFLK